MNKYSKTYIEITTKDYPIGKKIRCHLWLYDFHEKDYIEREINLIMLTNSSFKDIVVNEIKIFSTVESINKPEHEECGSIIIDATMDSLVIDKKENTNTNNQIDIKKLTDKELSNLSKKINIEIEKRKFQLNDNEYEFYIKNKEYISNIDDVKEIYNSCNGDIYKLKKIKIRELLNI